MKITSIDIVNWKCFEHKKMDFDQFTLLNWGNGEGKTSLIEAINLCLFNKRPNNLDFESLVDISKPTRITLTFTHEASVYVVEREVGKTSAYRVYKNEELISRTASESKAILESIISESVLTSLWGCAPLGQSTVLDTAYLFKILEPEFKEALDLKQYFNNEKNFSQKRKSSLEKIITNQNITQADVDKLKEELDALEAKIKEKAFISDSEVVRAKKAKEDYAIYQQLMAKLPSSVPYDLELCRRLKNYGTTEEAWKEYFDNIRKELEAEKKKSQASPLTKYPKNVIASLINESKKNCTCILCGGSNFTEPHIDYDTIDTDKILRLEKVLEDEKYSFRDFVISARYWSIKKQLTAVEYSATMDFESILNNYNKDTNALYADYEAKKKLFAANEKDLAQINELLSATQSHDEAKQCVAYVEEFIQQAKEYYATSIVEKASNTVKSINPRYVDLFIENGVYKAKIWDKDYTRLSTLPVQSLSNGEKTCAALALILAIRDLFMPELPLVMDESFVNLDAKNLEEIKNIIKNDTNQWIVVSHDERLIN